MKYHYVYIITNKINHKFYIGKHSTDDLDDGYMGSGIAINKAIQKYGIENFSKRILCFCDSAEDAYKVEEFLVTDNLIKRDDCYNMMVGGGRAAPILKGEKNGMYGKHLSEETKKKLSEAHKGLISGHKGMHHSEETKKKISEANKGKLLGDNNPMYGKHHSEEIRKKISEARKGKYQTKYKWLTPTGEIKIMCISNVQQWHQDWVLYEQN